jgi:hypothetical protein
MFAAAGNVVCPIVDGNLQVRRHIFPSEMKALAKVDCNAQMMQRCIYWNTLLNEIY